MPFYNKKAGVWSVVTGFFRTEKVKKLQKISRVEAGERAEKRRIEVRFWAKNGGGGGKLGKMALRLRSGSSKARLLGWKWGFWEVRLDTWFLRIGVKRQRKAFSVQRLGW